MGAMNKQMNLPALSNIMREFDRQNERMEMTSEMMGDAVDDAFEASHVFCCISQAQHWQPSICTEKYAWLRAIVQDRCWVLQLIYLAHASGFVLSAVKPKSA